MLSYQHAYHAGNPADVHKHIVLAELITLLTKKPRGITLFETHAGRGIYDLSSVEAEKTGEAAEGIEKLSLPSDSVYGSILKRLRQSHGPHAYPGSPYIGANLLRDVDRHILMELHPAEYPALKSAMKNTTAEIHHRDGYEGVMAMSPPTPRRGLVLIDPAYEVKTEYDQVADFTKSLHKKWPEAAIAIWYPILSAGRHEGLIDALSPLDPFRHEVSFTLKQGKGMTASGMLLINPPYGYETAFETAMKHGGAVLKVQG